MFNHLKEKTVVILTSTFLRPKWYQLSFPTLGQTETKDLVLEKGKRKKFISEKALEITLV